LSLYSLVDNNFRQECKDLTLHDARTKRVKKQPVKLTDILTFSPTHTETHSYNTKPKETASVNERNIQNGGQVA